MGALDAELRSLMLGEGPLEDGYFTGHESLLLGSALARLPMRPPSKTLSWCSFPTSGILS